jgi:hypothetical protein
MSAESLPHALLIVLVEFTIGSLWVLALCDARGNATASFIKFGAVLTLVMAALTFWLSTLVDIGDEVDGYPLDADRIGEAQAALAAVFALSGLYAAAAIREHRVPGLVFGAMGSLAGIAAIAFLAQVISIPTWGFLLVFASLAIGALAVGAVSMGMILGHWYLVTPRLPEAPLREMTGLLLVVIALQGILIVASLALPRDAIDGSVTTPILENPFLWMRIGFGLAFPGLLVWMAFDSSKVRAMQSATGLLYIAMALVLCGEVVAKGLLFASAVPN